MPSPPKIIKPKNNKADRNIWCLLATIIWFSFPLVHGLAQGRSDTLGVSTRTSYIEDMDRSLNFKLSFSNELETFTVKATPTPIKLYPNSKSNLSLHFAYRFVYLVLGFAPDFLPGNSDQNIKGNTKQFVFGSGIVLKQWYGHINYKNVEGYYLQNTKDFDSNWDKGDPYIQFPNLNYEGLTLKGGYLFNPRYSILNVTTQTERQIISAGSLIPAIDYRYYVIDDKSSSPSSQRSTNQEIRLSLGYFYTWVAKPFLFVSGGLAPGIGYQDVELVTRTPSGDFLTTQNNTIYFLTGRAALGHNGAKFFYGGWIDFSRSTNKQENTTVSNNDNQNYYQLYTGIRINSKTKSKSK